jgi:hypothetical protein
MILPTNPASPMNRMIADGAVDTGVVFAREGIAGAWSEAWQLIQQNHAETGHLPGSAFGPRLERFVQLEQAGCLRTCTMRLGAGELVGYAVFVVTEHLDYPGALWATAHVLYVTPEHRGRRAIRFLQWQDATLKQEGIAFIVRQVNPKRDHSRTLERLGYLFAERVFLKEI